MSSESPVAPSPSSRLRLSVPVVSHVQIDGSEFAALLAEHPLTGSYGATTVLDVRGEDYPGGHIRGSVHLTFDDAESQGIDSVLTQLQSAGTKRLIVLDGGSRQQASVVAELVLAKLKEGDKEESPLTVYVLTTGFAGVLNEHVNIAADRSSIALKDGADKLIEDFDAARWVAVSVSRTPSNAALPHSANTLVYKHAVEAANEFVSSPKAE